jgi:hypothetical protein
MRLRLFARLRWPRRSRPGLSLRQVWARAWYGATGGSTSAGAPTSPGDLGPPGRAAPPPLDQRGRTGRQDLLDRAVSPDHPVPPWESSTRAPATPRQPGAPPATAGPPAPPAPPAERPPAPSGGRHRRGEWPQPAGAARVGLSQPDQPGSPIPSPVKDARVRNGRAASRGSSHRAGAARAAVRTRTKESTKAARPDGGQQAGPAAASQAQAATATQPETAPARMPWYEVAHARKVAEGRRDCGPLEQVLQREWEHGVMPPAEIVRAIDRLAALPRAVSERLAAGLDAIHIGPGGVPDLDHMSRLHGVPLPSGRATWDACAGAYGERKIIVGTRPSATPDVVCHEVGHALDDIDGSGEMWQSDSEEFRELYRRCVSRLVSDFHRQEGSLGRREFFADAFAAIASSQRPALVDMLGGDTRVALDVMLYFNVRYGI